MPRERAQISAIHRVPGGLVKSSLRSGTAWSVGDEIECGLTVSASDLGLKLGRDEGVIGLLLMEEIPNNHLGCINHRK